MNSISLKHGREGDRHDPTHWFEVTVNGRNGSTTYHSGLACWCKRDDGFREHDEPEACFEALTGISPWVALEVPDRIENRRINAHLRKCGASDLEWFDGHPGETLGACPKCKAILYAEFNPSAVE